MLNRRIKRILTLITALALLLSCSAPVLAEQATVYAARDNAKVYNAKGKVVASLSANTQLTLTGVKGDVCRVERDGKTAFMYKADLSATPVAAEATAEPADTSRVQSVAAYVNKEGATVYSAGGKPTGTLGLNAEVTVTAVKGSVCQIVSGGRTGYMRKGDLSARKVEEKQEQITKNVAAYVNKDGANVYTAGGKAAGTLNLNAEVTVTAVKGSVCQIVSGGKTGYMNSADLSCDKTETQQSDVVEIQETTGYVNTDGAKVYDATGKAIATLALNTAVTVNAYNDNLCQVVNGSTKGYMRKSELSDSKTQTGQPDGGGASAGEATGESTVTPARGTAIEMDWWDSDIQTIFARGVTVQITDVETGLSWREQRRGGTNHADCQPLTAADTAVLKRVYGGSWSWNRRAIFVTINGVNYAASMNGMPHGSGSIDDNNFNGHHCIHFTNSRTHGSNKVCPLHQAAIKKAAAATL